MFGYRAQVGMAAIYMPCRVSIPVNAPHYVMRRVKLQTNNVQMKRLVKIIKHIAFSHIYHLLIEINFHNIQWTLITTLRVQQSGNYCFQTIISSFFIFVFLYFLYIFKHNAMCKTRNFTLINCITWQYIVLTIWAGVFGLSLSSHGQAHSSRMPCID